MDTVVTIFSWGMGIGAFFFLFMMLAFAASKHTQSKVEESDWNIITSIIGILLIVLVIKGLISLFSESAIDGVGTVEPKSEKTRYDEVTQTYVTVEIPKTEVEEVSLLAPVSKTLGISNNEVLLWIGYAFFFIAFFSWLFTPSKGQSSFRQEIQTSSLDLMKMQKNRKQKEEDKEQ